MLRKDNKSPTEIKVLDRFAEQSGVEEIQPWEESKDALGQFSSDEDNLGPHLLLQQEINSSLPKLQKKKRDAGGSELEHNSNREILTDNTNL